MLPLHLTFDDGPDRHCTAPLLDLLQAASATATFFPIAPRAQGMPSLIARMRAEGHTIGLHCDEHVRHTERDREWCARDVERALARLRDIGVRPTLWRTPWGVRAPWTQEIAAEHGLRLTQWSADTHDWRGDDATAMFASTRPGLESGGVVLAHDGIGPGARRADAAATLDYVRLVIADAGARELALEALR
jgi:peptidoglycan/xylan/chitin deacetylase (PgdA/CDA1 family)